jgi:hypothetical protein
MIRHLGSNIRTFAESTDVQVVISPSSEPFPGTDRRVIQLTSPIANKVANAAAIIWEVIALEYSRSNITKGSSIVWKPPAHPTHEFDSFEIEVLECLNPSFVYN